MKDQMIPSIYTVEELIQILSKYPKGTPISGVKENTFSQYMTIQANSPDGELDNLGLYFWNENDLHCGICTASNPCPDCLQDKW